MKCSFTLTTAHPLLHNKYAISLFCTLAWEHVHNRNAAVSDVWLAWPPGRYEVNNTAACRRGPPGDCASCPCLQSLHSPWTHLKSLLLATEGDGCSRTWHRTNSRHPLNFLQAQRQAVSAPPLQERSISISANDSACSPTCEKGTLSFRNSSFCISCLQERFCWCDGSADSTVGKQVLCGYMFIMCP